MLSKKINSFLLSHIIKTAFVSFSFVSNPTYSMDELDPKVSQAIPDNIKHSVHSYLRALPKLTIDEFDSLVEKSQKVVDFLISLSPKRNRPQPLEFKGRELLIERLQHDFQSNQPLSMITIGFPSKSTNEDTKVLSEAFDMGEFFGLLTYDYLCRSIKKVHEPGVMLTIYSDGLPYNRLLGIEDNVFERYQSSLKNLIALFDSHLCLWRF